MILYALIAKGTFVSSEYSKFEGDFAKLARQVLLKAQKSSTKRCYKKGEFSFYLFWSNVYKFLCVTDEKTNK